MRCFLDTNVLVYLFDDSEPEKQRIARELLAGLRRNHTVVLSMQVLKEFFDVTTRRLRPALPVDRAADALRAWLTLPVVATDADLLMGAVDLVRSDGVAFWDALIVKAAQKASCDVLYSEDLQHGRAFDGLTVENPFRPPG